MHKILSTPIPAGGFGRPLTSTERRRLRAAGVQPVSERAIVLRHHDSPSVGLLYEPCREPCDGSHYANSCVKLTLA